MTPPQFFGGDDVVRYLKALAAFSRNHPGWGLQVEMSFDRLTEAVIQTEERHALTLRDLARDIESLSDDRERRGH